MNRTALGAHEVLDLIASMITMNYLKNQAVSGISFLERCTSHDRENASSNDNLFDALSTFSSPTQASCTSSYCWEKFVTVANSSGGLYNIIVEWSRTDQTKAMLPDRMAL